jgi:hypothetical protein
MGRFENLLAPFANVSKKGGGMSSFWFNNIRK